MASIMNSARGWSRSPRLLAEYHAWQRDNGADHDSSEIPLEVAVRNLKVATEKLLSDCREVLELSTVAYESSMRESDDIEFHQICEIGGWIYAANGGIEEALKLLGE